ncbi:MAG TPA: thioredoxin family protein [Candidatus Onthocola stercoravium]|nr:thioredoxin family protein [Candidatus Onthocola stercoravium]
MNIKIVGSNCSNGIKLKKLLLKVANNYDGDVEIELKDDQESMRKYNIKNIPGLVINGKKFSEGKVPNDREILKYIKSYAAN